MTTATINRIRENSCKDAKTVIGSYTYCLGWDHTRREWDIFRAKTEELGREWITSDGQIVSAWKPLHVTDQINDCLRALEASRRKSSE